MPNTIERKKILGVPVDFGLNYDSVVNTLDRFVREDKSHLVVTVNPEFIIDAQYDKEFMSILNTADLAVPDGVGVLFAYDYLKSVEDLKNAFGKGPLFPLLAFFLGTGLGLTSIINSGKTGFGKLSKDIGEGRITGSDLTYKICENAQKNGQTVFLLGGRPRTALGKVMAANAPSVSEEAAKVLVTKYPDLNIVGASSAFSRYEQDDEKTLEFIHKCMRDKGVSHLDYLIIAYGHNHQEKWLMRNMSKIPVRVGLGVGAGLDYIIGLQKRSPEKLKGSNLEWVHRLITQPWRSRRIFKAFPQFPLKVYLDSLK